jgi:hypothetical protein
MKNVALQISLIDDREEVIKALEPDATTVAERLEIMRKYSSAGIWVACRIQPMIIGLSEPRIKIFIKKLADAGVKHVMVEGLKLFSGNSKANKRISDAFKICTGKTYDLAAYYKAIGSKNSGNDLELPTWRKYKYAKIFVSELKKYNMTYGAADNDLRFLGDSPCCCGIENLPFFENAIKHNTGYAVFDAMRKGYTKFDYSNIENYWFPSGKFRRVISVEKLKAKYGENATYKDVNTDIKEMFMNAWNNGGKNSPIDQLVVKDLGNGTYSLKDKAMLSSELSDEGEQSTLF